MDRWLVDLSVSYAGRVRKFADVLDTACRRQATGVGRQHWPRIADPADWLHRLFADLKVACDHAGESADEIFSIITTIFEDVAASASAYRDDQSLGKWGRCRFRVRERLDKLVRICEREPTNAVLPSVAATAAAPRVAIAPETIGDQRGKRGEKAENATELPDPAESAQEIGDSLPPMTRRILKAMLAINACSENDRTSADGIIEELRDQFGVVTTKGKLRRPMDRLRSKQLTFSTPGKGTWLTPRGTQVAKSL
jgi:hypothetical protein